MGARLSSDTILPQTAKIVSTWKENADFALGATKLKDFEDKSAEVLTMDEAIDDLRVKLTGMIDRRDTAVGELNDMNVRARAGFKAIYGGDSPQYKQAGGTPTSERKARTSRVIQSAATPNAVPA